jgi:hypothetical protein
LKLLKRNFTAMNKYHKNGLSLEMYFNQFLCQSNTILQIAFTQSNLRHP